MRSEHAPQPEVAEDDSLIGVPGYAGRLTMASIPYLIHDRSFVQGIMACYGITAAMIAGATTGRRRRLAAVA